jgi:TRAP-type C4-dicarboxylate transport system substrate-binding protein
MQIAGLVQSRDEALHLLSALRPRYEPEARQQGYEVLGASTIGPALAFLDRPVKDLAELRALRLWLMPDDDVSHLMAEAMGMKTVRLPLAEAAHAFDDKKIDGFFTIPGAALAFQWSIRARYLPDLRVGWVAGCFLVSSRAFYRLSQKGQQALRSTSAKLTAHMEDVARQQDQALLEGGLFQKQGVKRFEVSRDLRAQFLAASREARDRLGPKLVSPELLQHVMSLLADWRAEHERR